VAAPLLLTGCFLTPGAFDSSLDLRRGGDFTFAYKGEIVFTIPDDMMGGKLTPWSDDQAVCEATDSSDGNSMESGKCTPAQIAEQKKAYEEEQKTKAAKNAEESKQFASLFGYAPGDDAANQRLAAQLSKYDGFRAVSYIGNGVFNVDYAKSGRLDHDFVFPVMMQGNIMFPFVLAAAERRRGARVGSGLCRQWCVGCTGPAQGFRDGRRAGKTAREPHQGAFRPDHRWRDFDQQY
jgi:hypothetical protein